MTRASTQLFGVETVSDYLALCNEAVNNLASQQDSVLCGFTAILAINHLPDWIEAKAPAPELAKAGICFDKDPRKKRDKIEARNPDLKLVRQIANGFKHLKPVHSTHKLEGYGVGPFGIGPCGAPYLLIDLGAEKQPSERWCVGLDLCQRVLEWWRDKLEPISGRKSS